jgi:hypothetical protein
MDIRGLFKVPWGLENIYKYTHPISNFPSIASEKNRCFLCANC